MRYGGHLIRVVVVRLVGGDGTPALGPALMYKIHNAALGPGIVVARACVGNNRTSARVGVVRASVGIRDLTTLIGIQTFFIDPRKQTERIVRIIREFSVYPVLDHTWIGSRVGAIHTLRYRAPVKGDSPLVG